MKILNREFYSRSPLLVAPELLGKILVRQIGLNKLTGRIVETEAYLAYQDEASHAFRGKTMRNQSLFKPAGHAYVYTIHTHYCLDIVCGEINNPISVLIRALEPLSGIDKMRAYRNKEKLIDLTTGPGKLSRALKITKVLDGVDMTSKKSVLYVSDDGYIPKNIIKTKRVGISKNIDKDYRFYIEGSKFISKL